VLYRFCAPCIKNFFDCIYRVLKTDQEIKEQELAALVMAEDEEENN
jgi:hypothetical protein